MPVESEIEAAAAGTLDDLSGQLGLTTAPKSYLDRALEALRATGAANDVPPVESFVPTIPSTPMGLEDQSAPAPGPQADQPLVGQDYPANVPAGQPATPVEAAIGPPPPAPVPVPTQAPINPAPTTLAGMTALEDDQLRRSETAALAAETLKLDAARSHQSQIADAYDRTAKAREAADAEDTRARQALNDRVDREQADWIREIQEQAKEEPDSTRWWDDRTNFSKAMWGLSLLFGAYNAGVNPGVKNSALDLVVSNINADVARQSDRLAREGAALKTKGTVMEARQGRLLSDLKDEHTKRLTRIDSLERAWVARAGVPTTEDHVAARAQSHAFFEQLRGTVIKDRRSEAFAAAQAGAARSFAARQAAIKAAADKLEKEEDRKLARELAQIKIDAKTGKTGEVIPGFEPKDIFTVSSSLGGAMVGGNTGGKVIVRKELAKDATTAMRAGVEEAYTLQRIKKALASTDVVDRVLGVSPELLSTAMESGYATAKSADPGGRVTDADLAAALVIATGIPVTGGVIDKVKLEKALSNGSIARLIDKKLADLPNRVAKHVESYIDEQLVGSDAKFVWSPPTLAAEEVPDPTASDVAGATPPPVPLTTSDFDTRVKEEEKNPQLRKTRLPDYDAELVKTARESYKQLSPEQIKAEAARTIADLQKKSDPWAGGSSEEFPSTQTTIVGIKSAAEKAIKAAEGALKKVNEVIVKAGSDRGQRGLSPMTSVEIIELMKRHQLTRAENKIDELVDEANRAYEVGKSLRGRYEGRITPGTK